MVKPFLKWAGGKSQVIRQIIKYLPNELKIGKINKYFEPFLGSGALFFYILENFPSIEKFYLSDINNELINTYKAIKENVTEVIFRLCSYEVEYCQYEADEKEKYYYAQRDIYNTLIKKNKEIKENNLDIKIAALFIFLNRTCYNGLYRVNANGDFNVPFGRHNSPKICDQQNLLIVSRALSKCELDNHSYEKTEKNVDNSSFVYFDPPYLTINDSKNFTKYSSENFIASDHKALAKFYKKLDIIGAKLMLSNSISHITDKNNDTYIDLYKGFHQETISAKRSINCSIEKRNSVNETLIINY